MAISSIVPARHCDHLTLTGWNLETVDIYAVMSDTRSSVRKQHMLRSVCLDGSRIITLDDSRAKSLLTCSIDDCKNSMSPIYMRVLRYLRV